MSDLAAWARAIGQTIRRLRLSQGLTQSDLAGDAFSKSYISQLERGAVVPSLRALDILAERLGVPSTLFIEGTGKSVGFLLKTATISCFAGDLERTAAIASRLESLSQQFRYLEHIEYQLLLIRLAGRRKRWEEVHDACRRLEGHLAGSPYKLTTITVPQNYWWGKAWLVEGNRRQAVRRWEMGLKHLHIQPSPPGEEGLLLMLELAELYQQLGDRESNLQVTMRIRATLAQLSSLNALTRWTLARYTERAHQEDGTVDVDHLEEAMAIADAEAWARAAAMLQAAALIRQRLDETPPSTSMTTPLDDS